MPLQREDNAQSHHPSAQLVDDDFVNDCVGFTNLYSEAFIYSNRRKKKAHQEAPYMPKVRAADIPDHLYLIGIVTSSLYVFYNFLSRRYNKSIKRRAKPPAQKKGSVDYEDSVQEDGKGHGGILFLLSQGPLLISDKLNILALS